jgi:hypothetical protein
MNLNDFTRHTLNGLEGVAVVVESVKSDAEADGLDMGELQTDVELKLVQAGIKVLHHDEWMETAGHPWLYVSVNTMKYLASYFFSVDVQLKQDVSLPRDPSILTSSATWEVGSIGFAVPQSFPEKIRESVSIYVNQFIGDFLSANAASV